MSRESRFKPFENKGLKLLALTLAVLSWMAIQEITSFEQPFLDIPVRVQHDIGISVLDVNPQTVDVRLRGTRSEILAMSDRDVRVEIDLQGQPFEEDLLIDLSDKQIIYPGGARLVEIDPSAIHIRMDQSIARRATVEAVTQGNLPEGYTLEGISTDPDWVRITGSRGLVDAVEKVLSQPIELSGKAQSFETRVPLVPPSPNWPARMEPESVLVQVDIAESFVSRAIEGVPLQIMRNPGDFAPLELSSEAVKVTLKGNPDVVAALNTGDLQAYVKAGSIADGQAVTRRIYMDIPPRVRLVSVEPKEIVMQLAPPRSEESPVDEPDRTPVVAPIPASE